MTGILHKDRNRIENIPFRDYLMKSSHYSFSTLKQIKDGVKSDFVVTEKMLLGKVVDDILTNKGSSSVIGSPLYAAAKDIAAKIKSDLGEHIIRKLTPQVSYFGKLWYDGFEMPVKGRPDEELMFGEGAIIDFKVNNSASNEKDCINLINFMGYDKQLWNYCGLAKKKAAFLFIYSTKAKKTFFLKRLKSEEDIVKCEEWWGEKVLEYGTFLLD